MANGKITFSTPVPEEEFYRQALGSAGINVNDLVDYYSRPESAPMTPVSPAQPSTGFVPASGAPAGMVYDAEVGDFVSPQKAAARDAIRAQRANLAMDRAVYGESPGYMSMTMRDDKGPYAYMGDMSPYTRPPDTYGQPVTPQTMGERALAEAQAGAERALYGGMGAITGGLVGEGTARNIKEFVSMARSPAIKEDVRPFIGADGDYDYARGSRAEDIADLERQLTRENRLHSDILSTAQNDPRVMYAYQIRERNAAELDALYDDLGELDPREKGISFTERMDRQRAKMNNDRLKTDYNLSVGQYKIDLKNAFAKASGGYPYDVSQKNLVAMADRLYDLQNEPVRALGYDREAGAPLTDSVEYTRREAMGERFTVTPEGEIVYQPRVAPRLYPNEDFVRIPGNQRAQFIPEQPSGVFTTDNPNLMPQFIRDRTDIVSYDSAGRSEGLRNFRMLDEVPAAGQRYMQYKVLPVNAPQSAYAPIPGTDYQSEAQQKAIYDYFGKFPNPPEGVTAADFEFERPKVDRSGMIRGAGAGMAAEGVYMGMQESTSVPAAYVKKEIEKLQGGNYIPDLSEVPEAEKPALYSEMISMLNFGLPDAYFGSARHKREEALSKQFGEPLTNEVKVARDMMKLTAKMQDQDIVKAGQPSLVDQFKDFGYTILEAEAAAALAGLL